MKLTISLSVLFQDCSTTTVRFQTLRSVREYFRCNGWNIRTYSCFFFYDDSLNLQMYLHPSPIYRYRSASQALSVVRKRFNTAKQLAILPY